MYSLTGDGMSQKLIELSEISSSASEIDGSVMLVANASNYGVIPNTNADVTIPLQNFINALGSVNYSSEAGYLTISRKEIKIPMGIYAISSTIKIPKHCNISGYGAIIVNHSEVKNFTALEIDAYDSVVSGFKFSGFDEIVYSNNSNTDAGAITFENVVFQKSNTATRLNSRSSITIFNRCKFFDVSRIAHIISGDEIIYNGSWFQPSTITSLDYTPFLISDDITNGERKISMNNCIGVPPLRLDSALDESAWVGMNRHCSVSILNSRFGGENYGGMTLINCNSNFDSINSIKIEGTFANSNSSKPLNPISNDKTISCVRIIGGYPREILIDKLTSSGRGFVIGYKLGTTHSDYAVVTAQDSYLSMLPILNIQKNVYNQPLCNSINKEKLGVFYSGVSFRDKVVPYSNASVGAGRNGLRKDNIIIDSTDVIIKLNNVKLVQGLVWRPCRNVINFHIDTSVIPQTGIIIGVIAVTRVYDGTEYSYRLFTNSTINFAKLGSGAESVHTYEVTWSDTTSSDKKYMKDSEFNYNSQNISIRIKNITGVIGWNAVGMMDGHENFT